MGNRQGGQIMRMYSETKGEIVIKTKFGLVTACPENFSIKPEDMADNQKFLDWIGAESGVFCLVPDELDIPF